MNNLGTCDHLTTVNCKSQLPFEKKKQTKRSIVFPLVHSVFAYLIDLSHEVLNESSVVMLYSVAECTKYQLVQTSEEGLLAWIIHKGFC